MPTAAAVTLTVPCVPRYARVVRTVVASCAALEDFSIDRSDDVRLFADECFNVATALGATELVVVIRPSGGAITLELRADVRSPAVAGGPPMEMLELLAGVIAPDARIASAEGLSIRATIGRLPT